jgi:hypothetical protein
METILIYFCLFTHDFSKKSAATFSDRALTNVPRTNAFIVS